jgi:hypothetical protein
MTAETNEPKSIMAAENSRVPKPPPGLKASGKALWLEVQVEYELERHEVGLLLTMCRTTDKLDDLAAVVSREGVMEKGTGRVHPALVEHRQQAIAYARLSAALRLPAGDEGDPAANRRPQRRAGVRGFYGPRGLAS